MTNALTASSPLVIWTGLGLVFCRWLPPMIPRWLGRILYWVGVPIQIFTLVHRTDFSQLIWFSPLLAFITLVVGFVLAQACYPLQRRWCLPQWIYFRSPVMSLGLPQQEERQYRGSYLLSSILGNTGFVGLGLATPLLSSHGLAWAVFYAITQNAVGTYGLGAFLSSYYGRDHDSPWWVQLRDVLTVPTIWAFGLGLLSRSWAFAPAVSQALDLEVAIVIPAAFVLIGMRLSQLPGWQSFRMAVIPTLIKALCLPLLMTIIVYFLGLRGDPALAVVLMAGTPTAFAALILAEEYELNSDLPTASIALTTVALILVLPLWIFLFRSVLI